MGRAPSPANCHQPIEAGKPTPVSIPKVLKQNSIRVNPRKSVAKELHPRRLYSTANSNPAFAGNNSA
ncbi:MAG: hypothetical protein WBN74_04570, partial [Candidatus Sulfotelmatobacter sp.]